MGMEQRTNFNVDRSKCIHCGKCVNVCSGMVLESGNAQGVEYTVIDDKDRVHEIWQTAYSKMESDARRHIYMHSFSDFYYGRMKESEKTSGRGTFCSAGRRTSLLPMSGALASGRRTARSTATSPQLILNFCAMPTALKRPL